MKNEKNFCPPINNLQDAERAKIWIDNILLEEVANIKQEIKALRNGSSKR